MAEVSELPDQMGWLPSDYAFAWFLARCDPSSIEQDRIYNFTPAERRYFNQLRSQAEYRESKRNATRHTRVAEGTT